MFLSGQEFYVHNPEQRLIAMPPLQARNGNGERPHRSYVAVTQARYTFRGVKTLVVR